MKASGEFNGINTIKYFPEAYISMRNHHCMIPSANIINQASAIPPISQKDLSEHSTNSNGQTLNSQRCEIEPPETWKQQKNENRNSNENTQRPVLNLARVQSLSTVFNNALCSHSFANPLSSGSSFQFLPHCGGLNFFLQLARAGLNFVSVSRIMAGLSTKKHSGQKKGSRAKRNGREKREYTKVHGGFSGIFHFLSHYYLCTNFSDGGGYDSVLMRRPLENVEATTPSWYCGAVVLQCRAVCTRVHRAALLPLGFKTLASVNCCFWSVRAIFWLDRNRISRYVGRRNFVFYQKQITSAPQKTNEQSDLKKQKFLD